VNIDIVDNRDRDRKLTGVSCHISKHSISATYHCPFSVVCLSVSESVLHERELCQNG